MGEVVPIRARERVELPPAPPPARKLGERFPSHLLAALLVPAAALAAGVGLQRWLWGPVPSGDVLVRWILLGTIAGAFGGALAGLLLGKGAAGKLLWLGWGALSPALIVLASPLVARAVRPIREAFAARQQQSCLAAGQPVCSLAKFGQRCREAAAAPSGARELARKLLGAPAQQLCDSAGCSDRFVYQGPWTPDDGVATGALVCSVVSDAAGKGVRFALSPGTAPR